MATQSDVDNAKKSIDQLDKDAQARVKKLEGAKLLTDKDARAEIWGNMKEITTDKSSLKLEGGFTRIQVGASDTVIYGFKGEVVAPLSMSFILGAEHKAVLGIASTEIKGPKSDDIGGAKWDNLLASKYERIVGQQIQMGASPKLKNEVIGNDKMDWFKRKVGSWASKAVNSLFKVDRVLSEVGTLEEAASQLRSAVSSCQWSGTHHKSKMKKYSEECSGKSHFKASTVEYKCEGWQMHGSDSLLNLFPVGECYMRGKVGSAWCGHGVKLHGSTMKIGVSF
jgi:hypothetical protein